jgi:acyl carrier protein phosphodiesterase
MHLGTSVQRLTALRKQLNELRKHKDESIVEFVGRTRALIGELALSGHKFENMEKELVTAVLLGLPDEYETIVTVLHGMAQAAPMPVEAV